MTKRKTMMTLALLALLLASACNAVTGIDDYHVAVDDLDGHGADSAADSARDARLDEVADAFAVPLDSASPLDSAPGTDSAPPPPTDSGRPVWDGAAGSCAPSGYYCGKHGDCCTGVCAKSLGCLPPIPAGCFLLGAACSAPYACCSSVCGSVSGKCEPAI